MQTVLITGANGFVGYYACDLFLKSGYKVIATGKGGCRLPFSQEAFIYESMDFTDAAAVKATLEKYAPAVVIHSGAMSKPDECELNKEAAYLTNVTATKYLLQEAAKQNAYFLFMSTDFVFDGSNLNYKETDPPAPVNYYGQTKVLAEEEVKKYPFGWSIVRTILVYGHPRSGRQNLLTIVAQALQEGRSLKIVDDQVRKPTFIEDLAAALCRLVQNRLEGIYHIAGKNIMTPYKMALAVAQYFNLNSQLIESVTASNFKEPAKRPPTTGFDLNKAYQQLNYNPVTFAEGLKKTFEEGIT